MSLKYLPFGFLALPSGQDRGVATLAAKLRVVCLQTLLSLPGEGLPGTLADTWRELQIVLFGAAKTHSAAALGAVAHIDILGPTLAVKAGAAAAARVIPDIAPTLICGLARAGALPAPVRWDAPVTRIVDAHNGRVLEFDPLARGLVADPERLAFHLGNGADMTVLPDDADMSDGPRWRRRFHPLRAGRATPNLAEMDTFPLAEHEAHPDKDGNALSLGDRSVEVWREALGEAMALIEVSLPTLFAEMTAHLDRIVPVGYYPERHLSASFREAPGLIYLSLHPNVLTMAEALVHEFQHSKLNLLRWFDPVLENGMTEWTDSPVRPDLRPLMGVLLAAHAFVPVAAMHRQLQHLGHPVSDRAGFAERRAQVLEINGDGLETLRRRGRPTPLGRRVIGALETLHEAVGDLV